MTTAAVAMAVALSPDGRLAASVDVYGVVRISDASTGMLLRQLAGPTQVATAGGYATPHTLAFSPDGDHLLATSRGYALIWNLELDRRSPEEVARVVAAKSPWRLVDGRLVRAR
jgi:WD40 repeat protein